MTTRTCRVPAARAGVSFLCVGLAVLALATPLAAQQAERVAPEFRAGQWAAQFTASSAFYGAGVLRFRSPESAWLIDGAVNLERTSGDASLSLIDNRRSSDVVTVMAGIRRYGAARGAVRAYHGAGLLADYNSQTSKLPTMVGRPVAESKARTYRGGVYAELGGSYFVTHNLSLGARGVARGSYGRTSQEDIGATSSKFNRFNLGLGSAQLQVALFF